MHRIFPQRPRKKQCKVIDLNNLLNKPKLPFIYLPSLDIKILLDSGASNSIINPKITSKFSEFYFPKPFVITSLENKVHSENNIRIPLLSELGIKNWINLHVVHWHDKFDVLLSSEDLLNLETNIDYKNNILKHFILNMYVKTFKE